MSTRIKSILKDRGIAVNALHKQIRGNRTNLYQVSSGFTKATIPMRERIAAVLGVGVEEIFDENGMAKK